MRSWMGWRVAPATLTKAAPTWTQWCDLQQHRRRAERPQRHENDKPFGERELARLSFVRWLYQSGRLAPTPSEAPTRGQTRLPAGA